MNDRITIRNLEVETIIGILPDERTTPQMIYLDIDMHLDLRPAAKSCDVSQTVDYGSLADEVRWILQSSQFLLLETAAHAVGSYVLAPPVGSMRADVESTKVTIRKPRALKDKGFPEVTIERRADSSSPHLERHKTHEVETLFECKDSLLHRIKMIEGSEAPPAVDINYTFQDLHLRTSGPHLLRVYRI